MAETTAPEWRSTACILCECNCGIEVQLGGEDGRRLVRFRGDVRHPASKGYACEKPHRLDYYQNNPNRLTSPLAARPLRVRFTRSVPSERSRRSFAVRPRATVTARPV